MLEQAVKELNSYSIYQSDIYIENAINYLHAFKTGNYSHIIKDEINEVIQQLKYPYKADIDVLINTITLIDNSINLED